MRTLLRYSIVHCFLGLAIDSGLAQTPPPPMPPEIQVELNKLEPAGIACRGYFVVSNGVSEPLKELRLDVFLQGWDHLAALRAHLSRHTPSVRKSFCSTFRRWSAATSGDSS